MSRWRAALVALITAAAVAGAYALLAQHSKAGAGRSQAPPTPVAVATVVRRNVPVVVEGIGTTQAYNTVVVKPRIAGQIADIDFIEGQQVRPGNVLVRLDSRLLDAQLQQSEAVRLSDRAKLDYARQELARLESEGAQGFVSRQLVDSQRSQVAVLKATVVADQAAVRNAKVQLSYAVIRAPILGITGIRMVDRGNMIAPSDAGIVVITQIKPIAVVFTLPASALAGLPQGRSTRTIAVEAFDAQDRKPLASGTLALVDNRIDPASNTARLKAIFANAGGTLRPGEFVNIHLRKSLLRGVLTVPNRAIQHGQAGPFVWLVRPNSTVELRPVAVGTSGGSAMEVTHGLAAGERVVIAGQYGLTAGAAVRVQALASAPSPSMTGDLDVP
ncbi:MAG: efflux RND transporter periplasmic adaptor subunit [Gammaproteobacteria bacterium]|nr:efflux RND transporter periplasmic adaptor subunit [Gammaproteobacteria bacterium]